MLRLTPEQIQLKLDFMDDYVRAHNAADGSKLDANANVTQKNIATLESELMAKTRLMNEPQKEARCCGAFDSPPSLVRPSRRKGYMEMETQ